MLQGVGYMSLGSWDTELIYSTSDVILVIILYRYVYIITHYFTKLSFEY